jgi:hypothetical protein
MAAPELLLLHTIKMKPQSTNLNPHSRNLHNIEFKFSKCIQSGLNFQRNCAPQECQRREGGVPSRVDISAKAPGAPVLGGRRLTSAEPSLNPGRLPRHRCERRELPRLPSTGCCTTSDLRGEIGDGGVGALGEHEAAEVEQGQEEGKNDAGAAIAVALIIALVFRLNGQQQWPHNASLPPKMQAFSLDGGWWCRGWMTNLVAHSVSVSGSGWAPCFILRAPDFITF